MDSESAVLRALIRAWDRPRGFPPQDVADLMGELRDIVNRARDLVGDEHRVVPGTNVPDAGTPAY